MLKELKNGTKVVGVKQTKRALANGTARRVYLALDADPELCRPVAELSAAGGVPVEEIPTMKQLGHACSISVPAAVAALIAGEE